MLAKKTRSNVPLIRFADSADRDLLSLVFGESVGKPLVMAFLANPDGSHTVLAVLLHERGGKLSMTALPIETHRLKWYVAAGVAANGGIGAIRFQHVPDVMRLPLDASLVVFGTMLRDIVMLPDGIGVKNLVVKGETAKKLSGLLKKLVMASLLFPSPEQAPVLPLPQAVKSIKKVVTEGLDSISEMNEDDLTLLIFELLHIPYLLEIGEHGVLYVKDVPLPEIVKVVDIPSVLHSSFAIFEYGEANINDVLLQYFSKEYGIRNATPGLYFPVGRVWTPNNEVGLSLLRMVRFDQVETAEDLVASAVLAMLGIQHTITEGKALLSAEDVDEMLDQGLRYLGCKKESEKLVCNTKELAINYLSTPPTSSEALKFPSKFRYMIIAKGLAKIGVLDYDKKEVRVDDSTAPLVAYIMKHSYLPDNPWILLHVGMLRKVIEIKEYAFKGVEPGKEGDVSIAVRAVVDGAEKIYYHSSDPITANFVAVKAPEEITTHPFEVYGTVFKMLTEDSTDEGVVEYVMGSYKYIHRSKYAEAIRKAVKTLKPLSDSSDYEVVLSRPGEKGVFGIKIDDLINDTYLMESGFLIRKTPEGKETIVGVTTPSWKSLTEIANYLGNDAYISLKQRKHKRIVFALPPPTVVTNFYSFEDAILYGDDIPTNTKTLINIISVSLALAFVADRGIRLRYRDGNFIVRVTDVSEVSIPALIMFFRNAKEAGCVESDEGIVCTPDKLLASINKIVGMTPEDVKRTVPLKEILDFLENIVDEKTRHSIAVLKQFLEQKQQGGTIVVDEDMLDNIRHIWRIHSLYRTLKGSDPTLTYVVFDVLPTFHTALKLIKKTS